MNFIFVCPEKNQVFEKDNFEIIENNGLQTDASGQKFLDAKVIVNCPLCGQKHIFKAHELSCPFEKNIAK